MLMPYGETLKIYLFLGDKFQNIKANVEKARDNICL